MTTLQGSPKARDFAYAKCMERPRSNAWKKNVSIVMNVAEAKAAKIFCERGVRGFVNGRIRYEDVTSVYRGELTPNLIKVFQGR